MYHYPGIAIREQPQIGDILVYNGSEWVVGAAGGQDVVATDLYIDPQNSSGTASDSNDGSSMSKALLTYKNGLSPLLDRKVITANPLNVHLMSDSDNDDIFWSTIITGGNSTSYVMFNGESPTVDFQGTVSAFTNRSNPTRGSITLSGAGVNFTGLTNRRVRVVSGNSPDCVAWVTNVISPTQANVTLPVHPITWASGAWALNDVISVERPTRMAAWAAQTLAKWEPVNPVYFANVGWRTSTDALYKRIGPVSYGGCELNLGWYSTDVLAYRIGCYIRTGNYEHTSIGDAQFYACSYDSNFLQSDGFSTFYNCDYRRTLVLRGRHFMFDPAFWQWSGPAIQVEEHSNLTLNGGAWGQSTVANTYGIRVRSGCQVTYDPAFLPSILGTAAFDVDVAGVQVNYVGLPFVNPANNGSVVDESP